MKTALKPSLNWLLVFVPAAVILDRGGAGRETWTFVAACLAVIPLAGWMGKATEHLAERTGEGIGGLLNATFGNAAELIIACMAMRKGLDDIVKASLTGSIIGNILLVLGAALLAGGVRHPEQRFNAVGARAQATLLTLAAIGLIAPAAFHHSAGAAAIRDEAALSFDISVLLLLTYGLGLWFSLKTHKHLFAGHGHSTDENAGEKADHAIRDVWPLGVSVAVLLGATGLVAWVSEILVGTVETAAASLGMSHVFVGVIVVAIIGNAAEHSTAIMMALKNRMDLSLGIAIGSSIQVALFVAPLLVVLSRFFAPEAMDLVFTLPEVIAVALAVAITSQIAGDGRSNWLEGILLLAVYGVFGIVFYFLPDTISAH
ncbi:MAG: calcium/proton exchanger [Verrucomicrobiae bacterium]|nr:calcium/proton exchanger [Verrucomicrobiae bacterium]MCP5551000.1 calcium/proton exchanger [Akkermansiaceae bacterium]